MSKNTQYGNPGVYRQTPVTLADGEAAALSVNSSGELIAEVNEITSLFIPTYDYFEVAYPETDEEVYTFKTGGSGGTTVATVTIVYTDDTKEFISTVTKTTP